MRKQAIELAQQLKLDFLFITYLENCSFKTLQIRYTSLKLYNAGLEG